MKKQFFTALCAMAMLLPTQAKDYKYDTVKGDLMSQQETFFYVFAAFCNAKVINKY